MVPSNRDGLVGTSASAFCFKWVQGSTNSHDTPLSDRGDLALPPPPSSDDRLDERVPSMMRDQLASEPSVGSVIVLDVRNVADLVRQYVHRVTKSLLWLFKVFSFPEQPPL